MRLLICFFSMTLLSSNAHAHLDRDEFFKDRIGGIAACKSDHPWFSGNWINLRLTCYNERLEDVLNGLERKNDLHTILDKIKEACNVSRSEEAVNRCFKRELTQLLESWKRYFPPHDKEDQAY